MKKIKTLITILPLLLLGMVSITHANVSPYPQNTSIITGETVSIDIKAAQVTELAGFEFKLSFDPALIKVESIAINDVFTLPVLNQMDNTAGTCTVAALTILSPQTGTDIILATLQITGLAEGSASINLTHTLLGKIGGAEIPSTPANGTITVIRNDDSDNDGILDEWEMAEFGDLTTANDTTDYDNDSLSDKDEYLNNTNPKAPDTDNDGLPDGWEVTNNLDPNDNGSNNPENGSNGNPDGDNFTNHNEYLTGSNPKDINSTPPPGIAINLTQGWNLFGWISDRGYHERTAQPDQSDYASGAAMTPVITLDSPLTLTGLPSTSYIVIMGPNGMVYASDSPFNTLTTLLPGKAYWIYINEDKTITLPGNLLPTASAMNFQEGWTQAGYWGPNNTDPTTAFKCIELLYDVIADASSGTVHIPGSPFNTLNSILQGNGYYIYTTGEGRLTYNCL